ncbi:hypothetical protein OHS33_36920 [Streptomyces sp. NBC_00536]|uniref:hypothetical protein n=1 Tax=Streptomyces sp. NBC_00536 TaxID=2975769 RepID=UPI002E80F930|nr:hypothetical protein [Streptomyces sp. NBC_00536]WUC83454.1 hypothetical protein OHS33_36920 [Streptomyces sp. NBC_00536]
MRAVAFVLLFTVVFLVTNTVVAAAADGNADNSGGGLLAPFNVVTAEGARLDAYQVQADDGGMFDVLSQLQVLVMSGLFTLARLLVGMCCWMIGFVFRFPVLALLTGPSQHLADAYQTHVVDALGLKGMALEWGFIFGLVTFMRGKSGSGFGQIAATLLIGALAASAFVRPDYLLGRGGPLDAIHQAAIEVASITTNSYFGTSSDPCDLVTGPGREACTSSGVQIARPVQGALTDALVVKPFMLLQYGQILDPKKDPEAYQAHLKWIKDVRDRRPDAGKKCDSLPDPAKDYCHGKEDERFQQSHDLNTLLAGLDGAGPTGKAAAAYAKQASWDRSFAALALLVACLVVASMVVSMATLMLGAQGADAAAGGAGPVVWVLAMLPGATRTLLWRWTGVLVSSALITFATAIGLPLFGIAAGALLSDTGPDVMVEHLLLLDALAVAFFVLHKRIAGAATSLGQRMALRMQYARLSGMGFRGAGLALGMAGHHAGPPFSPGGRALGEARGALRAGLAPAALALRGAHAALVGPKPGPRHPAAQALHAVLGGRAGVPGAPQGEMQVDQWTGEILHDPATDRPLLASRIHGKASRLRGYRIAHRIGKTAYGATVALPRTLHNAQVRGSEVTEDARTQLRVSANRIREDIEGWEPMVAGTVRAGRAVGQGAAATGRTVRDAAIGATIYTSTGTTGRAPGPRTTTSRPFHPTATSAPASPAMPATPNTTHSRTRTPNPGPGIRPTPRRTTTARPGSAAGSGSGPGSDGGRPTGNRTGSNRNPGSGSTPAAPAADQGAANTERLREAMNRRRTVRRNQEGESP